MAVWCPFIVERRRPRGRREGSYFHMAAGSRAISEWKIIQTSRLVGLPAGNRVFPFLFFFLRFGEPAKRRASAIHEAAEQALKDQKVVFSTAPQGWSECAEQMGKRGRCGQSTVHDFIFGKQA